MADKDTNIYIVQTSFGRYLVDAKNKVAALNFIVQNTHTVKLATQKDIIEAMKAGVEVQNAAQVPFNPMPPTE